MKHPQSSEGSLTTPNAGSESLYVMAEEFVRQNELIAEEISKHDQSLRTPLMLFYRLCVGLYAVWSTYSSIKLVSQFVSDMFVEYTIFWPVVAHQVYQFSQIFLKVLSICGCAFLSFGIFKRDLSKVERSFTILKIYLVSLNIIQFVKQIGEFYFAGNFEKTIAIWYSLSLVVALINIPLIKYVKKLLEKRKEFVGVSSSHE